MLQVDFYEKALTIGVRDARYWEMRDQGGAIHQYDIENKIEKLVVHGETLIDGIEEEGFAGGTADPSAIDTLVHKKQLKNFIGAVFGEEEYLVKYNSENAVKKAKTLAKMLEGKMCLADDSGIEIEYLNGLEQYFNFSFEILRNSIIGYNTIIKHTIIALI